MSASSDTSDSRGWPRHIDALPLLDDPAIDEAGVDSTHRMHWISAAIALALLVLARLDLLPAMPW